MFLTEFNLRFSQTSLHQNSFKKYAGVSKETAKEVAKDFCKELFKNFPKDVF